jgi:hypothetical protein
MGEVRQFPLANRGGMTGGSSLPPGGPPPYDGGMEARVAVLEQIATSTQQLLAKMDARLDRIENNFVQIDKRLDGMDQRLDQMDKRLDQMDKRLDRMDTRMDRIEDRQVSDFKSLLVLGIGATGTLFAAMLGLVATMAHGFHWI